MGSQSTPQANEFSEIIAMFRRHAGKFIGIILLGVMISMAVALSLPTLYRSTATILIERQDVPEEIVTSTVSGYIEARLAAIERRVLAGDNLWRLVEQYDLFREQRREMEPRKIIAHMRQRILRETVSVETVNPRNGREVMATVAFTISFEAADPQTAQQVATALANGYLAENTRARTSQASQVSTFLTNESERLEAELAAIEQKLANFKKAHLTELPEYTEVNRRMLEQAEDSLARIEERIHSLQQRKKKLQTELAMMQAQDTLYTSSGNPVLSLEQELGVLRAELAQARTRYSEQHPDVMKLKQEVAALERQVRQQDSTRRNDNNVMISQSAYIALKAQLDAINDDLQVEQATRAQLQEKVQLYTQRLAKAPSVERDYIKLVRSKDNILKSYEDIKRKLVEAQLAEQLERKNKAERFTLVEPAPLPIQPESPNRPGIALLGTVLALGSGIGLVSVAEYRDHSVHGPQGVQKVLEAPPLAVIPYIATPQEQQMRSRKRRYWIGLVVLIVLSGLALLYWYGSMTLNAGEAATLGESAEQTAFKIPYTVDMRGSVSHGEV